MAHYLFFYSVLLLRLLPSSGEQNLDWTQGQLLHVVPGIHTTHARRRLSIDAEDLVAGSHLVGLLSSSAWIRMEKEEGVG